MPRNKSQRVSPSDLALKFSFTILASIIALSGFAHADQQPQEHPADAVQPELNQHIVLAGQGPRGCGGSLRFATITCRPIDSKSSLSERRLIWSTYPSALDSVRAFGMGRQNMTVQTSRDGAGVCTLGISMPSEKGSFFEARLDLGSATPETCPNGRSSLIYSARGQVVTLDGQAIPVDQGAISCRVSGHFVALKAACDLASQDGKTRKD